MPFPLRRDFLERLQDRDEGRFEPEKTLVSKAGTVTLG